MKRALLWIALLLPLAAFSQQEAPVEVCDLALVLKSNETRELYYGFAAGDRSFGWLVAGLRLSEEQARKQR